MKPKIAGFRRDACAGYNSGEKQGILWENMESLGLGEDFPSPGVVLEVGGGGSQLFAAGRRNFSLGKGWNLRILICKKLPKKGEILHLCRIRLGKPSGSHAGHPGRAGIERSSWKIASATLQRGKIPDSSPESAPGSRPGRSQTSSLGKGCESSREFQSNHSKGEGSGWAQILGFRFPPLGSGAAASGPGGVCC